MLIKTLSTKTVYGDKEAILKAVMSDTKKEHFLYRIFGEVQANQIGKGRHKRVDRETGESVDTFWTKFFGEFFAVNSNKEEFEGATAFLPDYVSGQFSSQLESGVTGITFAFDVYAVYNKDSITSYEFIAQAVRSGEEKSKVELMHEQMPALPNDKAKALENKSKK